MATMQSAPKDHRSGERPRTRPPQSYIAHEVVPGRILRADHVMQDHAHAHDETQQLQQESRADEVGAPLPPPRLCQGSHPCQIRQRHSEQGRRAFLPALAKLRPLGIEAGAGRQSARLASPKEQFPPEGKEVPHSLRRWSLTPA
jgi:hypothetical protein